MNIKRAFFAAIAVSMMPAIAMAQTFFPTTVMLTNGADATVSATITCNSGIPLTQTSAISNTSPITFTVADLPVGSMCDIVATSVGGYTAASDCSFTTIADQDTYSCDFEMSPNPFVFTITKHWEFTESGPGQVDLGATVDANCWEVRATADATVNIPGPVNFACNLYGQDDTCSSPSWYADPNGATWCNGVEDPNDSAVESDQGCASPTSIVIGQPTAGCTVNNTVFFEGIPTLNQYGMAILALLMLGVGFVGFRRFA